MKCTLSRLRSVFQFQEKTQTDRTTQTFRANTFSQATGPEKGQEVGNGRQGRQTGCKRNEREKKIGLKSTPRRSASGTRTIKLEGKKTYAWRQEDEVWKTGCAVSPGAFGATVTKNCPLQKLFASSAGRRKEKRFRDATLC